MSTFFIAGVPAVRGIPTDAGVRFLGSWVVLASFPLVASLLLLVYCSLRPYYCWRSCHWQRPYYCWHTVSGISTVLLLASLPLVASRKSLAYFFGVSIVAGVPIADGILFLVSLSLAVSLPLVAALLLLTYCFLRPNCYWRPCRWWHPYTIAGILILASICIVAGVPSVGGVPTVACIPIVAGVPVVGDVPAVFGILDFCLHGTLSLCIFTYSMHYTVWTIGISHIFYRTDLFFSNSTYEFCISEPTGLENYRSIEDRTKASNYRTVGDLIYKKNYHCIAVLDCQDSRVDEHLQYCKDLCTLLYVFNNWFPHQTLQVFLQYYVFYYVL